MAPRRRDAQSSLEECASLRAASRWICAMPDLRVAPPTGSALRRPAIAWSSPSERAAAPRPVGPCTELSWRVPSAARPLPEPPSRCYTVWIWGRKRKGEKEEETQRRISVWERDASRREDAAIEGSGRRG
nr:unnamed protein product [Digitaria exilis]